VARAAYTESEKAHVYVVLTANEGNVKRTARDTGTPEQTVRRWRDEWQKNGPPQEQVVQEATQDYVASLAQTRDLALQRMHERLVRDEGTLPQIATVFGVLTDKINIAQGLDVKRVEHTHNLPSADQVRELMSGFVSGMQALAVAREAEIIEAEVVEVKELPR
jgi:transposase-like protein